MSSGSTSLVGIYLDLWELVLINQIRLGRCSHEVASHCNLEKSGLLDLVAIREYAGTGFGSLTHWLSLSVGGVAAWPRS